MNSEKKETWIDNRWRPAMGWMYFVVCITDFILFPILQPMFQSMIGMTVTPWKPLTLENGGLFHVAMGAIVGVTAWSRGKEKMFGVTTQNDQDTDPVIATPPSPIKRRIEPRLSRPDEPTHPEL